MAGSSGVEGGRSGGIPGTKAEDASGGMHQGG
jgi:hypothetical protein